MTNALPQWFRVPPIETPLQHASDICNMHHEAHLPLPSVSKPELMPTGDDTRFRSFIHDFLAFSARVQQCRTRFGELLGISGVAYTILITIAHLEHEDGLGVGVGVSRVADHLHLSGAFVTIEVSKLVKSRFVRKRVNVTDRRRVLLTITNKGREHLDGLSSILSTVNDALFECLSASEFLELSSMMTRLVPCGDKALELLAYLSK
ncbi:MarR family winged helix-turn-helix transcriptional regulator [Acidiphilium sp. AL]|uniref:MarR family winged helix-turn-helix transcriptional regulator n=1 Tax=Acidiphilium iwatense TaxID=768198 RepID=A0ABS9E3R4_9PROT|nr:MULTISPECIES: MarR family winged helix-turn-helix transcriptional regulator [Acidiphilium]MCF3948978.1 MarR family winged helix-turn-helix transcriptional regulator [Acidiphilium iwatense]MCU4162308.1 MarR family winged helix-turn-helix transcriptional regulator [Acidiphilium sp. AL]